MSRSGRLLADARFRLRFRLAERRVTHLPVRALAARRHPEGQRFVDTETTLLVDGFPGSGNTWLTRTLRDAHPRPDTLAHHAHAAAHVEHALRRGVATVVVVREPVGAVTSTTRRWGVDPGAALTAWVRYHRVVTPFADRIFVVDFDRAVADPPALVRAVEERFGLGLAPEAVEREGDRHRPRRGADERARRAALREQTERRLDGDPGLRLRLDEARDLHDRLVGR